jgi:suppressor of ftsI
MSGAIVVEGLERTPGARRHERAHHRLARRRDGANYVDEDMRDADATGVGGTPSRPRAANNGSPCRAEDGLQPTLNRLTHARIGIEPGEREFFRVVNASAARHFDLSIDGSRLQLIAIDGVALDAYPGTPAVRTSITS